MVVRSLRPFVGVLALGLALAGCHRQPWGAWCERELTVTPARCDTEGGTVARLRLETAITRPEAIVVELEGEVARELAIVDAHTLLVRVPPTSAGPKRVAVSEAGSEIASAAKALECGALEAELRQVAQAFAPAPLGPKPGGSSSNWWMLHMDLQHQSHLPATTVVPLASAWTSSLSEALLLGQPIAADGSVVTAISGNGAEAVVAWDPASGARRWSIPREPPAVDTVQGSPVADQGRVCFVQGFGSPGTLRCVDSTTGADLWRRQLGASSQGGLAAAFDRLYVLTRGGELTARHFLTDGAEAWNRQVPVGAGSTLSSPALGMGNVYVGSSEGLHAFDAISGELEWKATTPPNGNASPVVVTDVEVGQPAVVAIGSDHVLRAFDATSGAPLWTFSGDAPLWFTTPATAQGQLYLRQQRTIVQLHAATGAFVRASPDLGELASGPTISGPHVLLTTGDEDLVALNLADLSIAEVQQLPGSAGPGDHGHPSVEFGRAFVSSFEGGASYHVKVHAYGP